MEHRSPLRRLLLLTALACVIALFAGGAAYVLVHLIGLLTNLALFHRFGWDLPPFRDYHPGPWLIVVAVGGGLIVGTMARWAPMIKGHGIPEAMEAVLIKQSRIQPRAALAKPVSAAIAIGTGAPFGAEGPIIVTGSSIGSLVGQLINVSPNERKILLASGAAAGMAATFGAPLASVVLAIELLLFEFSTRAFVPLVVASSIAAGVHALLWKKAGPLFEVPVHHFSGLDKLPLYIPLGICCGLFAVLIVKGLSFFEDFFSKLPVHEFFHPAIGAVGFALVGFVAPRALGVGYDAIGDVLAAKLTIGALALLAGAKLLAWWLATSSGSSAGTLAPILLMSASVGGFLGEVARLAFPTLAVSPGAFAMVAMAAIFGAATRATFASIVFVFELTRDYNVILPLMLASVIADIVSVAFLKESLMTEKLARRGLKVHQEFEADVMRSTRVRDVMTRNVETLPNTATLDDAQRLFRKSFHTAYPVVDEDQRCVGIVARKELLRAADGTLADVAKREVVTVSPDATLMDALETMWEEEIEHLPVREASGKLIGILTRTDVLRARRQQIALENRQVGWLGHVHLPHPRHRPRENGTRK